MDIMSNLNKRLTTAVDSGGVCPGGEEYIKKVMEQSPVKLPDDYIDFLRVISGDENIGISFQVDSKGQELFIWSAKFAYESRIYDYSLPVYEDVINCTWVIGDNVGEVLFFYGVGNDGFGIYGVDVSEFDISVSTKIADSLTDLLVNGVGLDILFK